MQAVIHALGLGDTLNKGDIQRGFSVNLMVFHDGDSHSTLVSFGYVSAILATLAIAYFGIVKAGTASAVHFELQAISGGRPVVILEHNDLVARDAGTRWRLPYGPKERAYRIEIEGDPEFTLELNMDMGPGCKMTAMPVINAIPAVCAASPGLKSPLEIPRYWSKNSRGRHK